MLLNIIQTVPMEEKTISLNAEQILRKTFTPNVKGYDPDEVDSFLDRVIRDYQSFESYYKESKKYIVELELQLRKCREANSNLTVENAKLGSRLAGVKDPSEVNSSNIQYVNRIAKLEKEIWRLGGNPSNIK